MPYITTERISEIREQIKKEFPLSDGWKFSITRHHHSTVCVAILTAPFNMLEGDDKEYRQVNVYHIASNYQGATKETLLRLYSLMNSGNRIISEDGDYGSIPAFYCNISIGQYSKPFVVAEVAKSETKDEPKGTEKVEVKAGEVQIIDYSEKAFAVVGDTYPIREQLKQLGGKFNKFLKCGPGWIFSKKHLGEVTAALTTKQPEAQPQANEAAQDSQIMALVALNNVSNCQTNLFN